MIRELTNGLVLRRAGIEDLPGLIDLHVHAHGERHPDLSNRPATTAHFTDLLTKSHPSFTGQDMTLVEDPKTGQILSAQHFSTHTWTYGGVPIRIGEVEHVSTHESARRQGLVRLQFEVMHQWAHERELVATVVNGIPWYYTQFGYELAREKWSGPTAPRSLCPSLKNDEPERYRLRPATPGDMGLMARAYEHGQESVLIGYKRTLDHWMFEFRRSDENPWRRDIRIVEDVDGNGVGFISVVPDDRGSSSRWVDAFEVLDGVPWALVTPAVIRSLLGAHDGTPEETRESVRFGWLGSEHPCVVHSPELFYDDPTTLHGAWYIRIPDMVAFLRQVTPALEARLLESPWRNYIGSITVSLYKRGGLEIALDRGAISIRPWQPVGLFDGDARFADQILEQLVLGYRSFEELRRFFVYRTAASPLARSLLGTLFPSQRSFIWPTY